MTKDEDHASWRLNHGLPESYKTTSEAIEMTRKIIEILKDDTQNVLPEEMSEMSFDDFFGKLEKASEKSGMRRTDIPGLTSFNKIYQEAWLDLMDGCFRIHDTFKKFAEKGHRLPMGWGVEESEVFLSILVGQYMNFNDFLQRLKIREERSHRVR